MSQLNLRAYADLKITTLSDAIAVAQKQFDDSFVSSYDLDSIATAIGQARAVSMLIKKTKQLPEGLEDIIISDKLYNRIKEMESIALTWIRSDCIKNAEIKLNTLKQYLETEELDRVKLFAFEMQVKKHVQWLSKYSIASKENTIEKAQYLEGFLNSKGKDSKIIARISSYKVTQSDMQALLEYGCDRLESQISSAAESINEVRAKMPGIHARMDESATFLGESYISLSLNDNPHTTLDDKFRDAMYLVIEGCMKYHRNYNITGAEYSAKTTKAIMKAGNIVQADALMALGRMKWHRKELEIYNNKDSVKETILNLAPHVDLYSTGTKRKDIDLELATA